MDNPVVEERNEKSPRRNDEENSLTECTANILDLRFYAFSKKKKS